MSIALAISSASADVTNAVHGDALLLQPAGVTVTGYAEDLAKQDFDSRGAKRHPLLHVGADLVSHIVHIRRSEIPPSVALGDIAEIGFGARSYRVQHFEDDPTDSEVDFYCKLA